MWAWGQTMAFSYLSALGLLKGLKLGIILAAFLREKKKQIKRKASFFLQSL